MCADCRGGRRRSGRDICRQGPISSGIGRRHAQDPEGASEPLAAAIGRVSNGAIEAYAENIPHGITAEGMKKLYQGQVALAGGAMLEDRIQFAFGAEFVEVRVHLRTREIRCPRIVGAFAAGQIVDPLTAKSQLMGGLIWGISRVARDDRDRSLARAHQQ